jgi:hypothetical protein
MSTLKVQTLQNSSGVEVYTCKAWVNFNGTGTVAIRASGNVSSITDNGTGDYTVNFTTAMPDANFSYGEGKIAVDCGGFYGDFYYQSSTASSLRIKYHSPGNTTGFDVSFANFSIFR